MTKFKIKIQLFAEAPPTKTTREAELETQIALLKQEAETAKETVKALEADKHTLIELNNRLQLAVGVKSGNDEPPAIEPPVPDTSVLQNTLIASHVKIKK